MMMRTPERRAAVLAALVRVASAVATAAAMEPECLVVYFRRKTRGMMSRSVGGM